MLKNRIGYILPLYSSFFFLDDNDYSDSFLYKAKMHSRESKSEYAYYIMTNLEFIIENISSSALNLGLSLDLIRKYSIKMEVLVRNEKDEALNIYDNYNEYEDETKVVNWVFPDKIYPKNAH